MQRSKLFLCGLLLGAGLFALGVFYGPQLMQGKQSQAEDLLLNNADIQSASTLSKAFRAVSKYIKPSVVSVRSVTRHKAAPRGIRQRRLPQGVPDEFRRFFDDDQFDDFFQFEVPQGERIEKGMGTGIIISEQGHLLTNNHVVAGADSIEVELSDSRTFEATIVGTDPKSDVAVLKIEAKGLRPAVLGNSDLVETGDWVLAIGSPFGLEQTVTAGIVSAKGRSVVGITDYEDFLQTDAAINPGNSGGPLVNLEGKVIGLNTAIASRGGGFNGVGFAIPINMAKYVSQSIMEHGKVVRGRIGAAIQTLDEGLADSFHFPGETGVLVGDIVPGSPAEKAGLKIGDIVMEYNGKAMATGNQLRTAVAQTKPDTRSTLKIFRKGKTLELPITIGTLNEEEEELRPAKENNPSEDSKKTDLGMSVRPLNDALRKELNLPVTQKGVVITDVEAGGFAQQHGLREGDVISAIGESSITNLKDFEDAMKQSDVKQGIRFQILRNGFRLFLFVREG